jgi:hypothetical protein
MKHGLDDNGAFMLTLHAITVRNKYRQPAESLAYGQTAIRFFDQYGGSPLACPTYKASQRYPMPSQTDLMKS